MFEFETVNSRVNMCNLHPCFTSPLSNDKETSKNLTGDGTENS